MDMNHFRKTFIILGYALIQLPDLMFWVYDILHDKFQSFFNATRNKDEGTKSVQPPILASWPKRTILNYEMNSSATTNDLDKDLIVISIGHKNIQMKAKHMQKYKNRFLN